MELERFAERQRQIQRQGMSGKDSDKNQEKDDSKLSYEDRVLKRMLNTPPPKRRKPDKQEQKPG